MLAELYVIKGREAGKALELSPGSAVCFGRALSNDIRIRDAQVSRVHCRFECTEAGVRLKDMSGNGTFVNDDRLKGVEVLLKDGDTVRLGGTEIRVLIESDAEARAREALAAERAEPGEDSAPNLSESSLDEAGRPAPARTLGQPKITLAELTEIKKARARRADIPPTSVEPIEPDEDAPTPVPSAAEESTEQLPLPASNLGDRREQRGATPPPPPPPPPPAQRPALGESGSHLREVIPGYRIEAKLGGGGRRGTVVYRAIQLSLDRHVALKVLLPNAAASEKDLGRFLREAAAIARLPHPNIVTVHDAGRAGERRFIVMEYLPGGSAADRIEDQRKLPLDEALALGLDVARALSFVHQRGIVHRSIRPANVLRDMLGSWKLVDFGLARDVMRGGGGETNFIDAPLEAVAYLAPEQVHSLEVDARSDVYSAGALIYHALTGRPPFWGESIGEIAGKIGGEPPGEPLDASAPAALATVVRRCLAEAPDDRYPEGQALFHELIASQTSIRPGRATPPRGARA